MGASKKDAVNGPAPDENTAGDAESIAVVAEKPEFELIVVHPFGTYTRGQHIKDAEEIKAVLASENAHHCHKIQPEPETKAEQ